MCNEYMQVQYTCTITYAFCLTCLKCKGHIEWDVPAEWVFSTDTEGLCESVERRWQVIKGDNNLRVSNFKIVSAREDVATDANQIGA